MDTPPVTPEPVPLPPAQPPSPSGLTDTQWAIIIHLSALLGFVIAGVGNIVAPLVIWLLKKHEIPYLDGVGKEVLNFQISFSIYFFISAVLCWALIGFFLVPIVGLLWLIFTIIGAVKVSNGEAYRFPMTIRML